MSCPLHRISSVWCSRCIPQVSDQRGRLPQPDPRDARIAELETEVARLRGFRKLDELARDVVAYAQSNDRRDARIAELTEALREARTALDEAIATEEEAIAMRLDYQNEKHGCVEEMERHKTTLARINRLLGEQR